ncbi:MAG: protein kinase [Chitinophagaceae bacterium]|nr:protein kinase [Chitinophagaceae bacterium]
MNAANNTQYIIQRKLGEGGMGTVYLAEDTLLERLVAIKELNISAAPVSESVGNRFQQEALALAKLNHPNITHLYAFIPKDDTYWMVMEYVDGKTLEEWLQARGSMQPATACSILVQILDGLHHAHRKGIIHRDLKPANVMISEEGEVKVMDFGIARIRNSQRMTQHGKSVGTLEYMAPEQIQGKEGDERTDIYAAGNILYELLCGQPPFRADTDYHLMKAKLEEAPPILPALLTVAPALKQIILQALSRHPEKRFETVTSFRDALSNCMQHSFLKESALILALTQPVSKTLPSHHLQTNTTISKWKSGAAAVSAGLLNNLSYHSKQVSDQFVRLISGKLNNRAENRTHKSGIAGFFSRVQQLVTDNALAFLLVVVLLCGILLLWNYFSDEPVDYTGNKIPDPSVSVEDSLDEQSKNRKNTYIIETQLSKVPPVTSGEGEGKDNSKGKTPKEKARKKTDDAPEDKSSTETPAEDDNVTETPVKSDPTPARREPTGPVTIPSGRSISLVLDETLSSEEPGRDGDAIRLRCTEDVIVEGRTIIRKGAHATGKIVDVVPANKRKRAMIGFVIQKVDGSNGSTIKVHSERFQMIAKSPGSPVAYHSGDIFPAKLGRGRFD